MTLTLVPDSELHEVCDYVKPEEVEALWPQIEAMSNLMVDKKGVGIAAAQVGINKRFFVSRSPENPKTTFVYFNPTYRPLKSHGEQTTKEACLSYPGEFYLCKRWKAVKVSYHEYNGKTKKFSKRDRTMTGFDAILFQHEIDHQFGKTIASEGVMAPKETEND